MNPNAILVMSPILVLTDSIQGIGQAAVEGGVDCAAVAFDLAVEVDEDGNSAALRPAAPMVQGLFTGVALDCEGVAEAPFEEVGPAQTGLVLVIQASLAR
ncbi:hypothetical protein GCM10009754_26730 [Amycolatopsis minnesotensis]|uniref:Uncharacterized protein n=1 Tax=Amycolatopsis minnesotensis TaxID=337894 RepID=A0ABP5C2X3_9PSEU